MTADDVELVSRETLFQGYLRVERLRLRHRLFAGGMGGEVVREVVERGHAVGVLPYDPVQDRVVLIEQFRVGVYLHDPTRSPWSLEIIAGIIEPGESAAAVSHREAEEEAGLKLEALEPMLDYYSSPGALSEHFRLFCARVDSTGAGGIHGLAAESEDIRVVVMSFRPGRVKEVVEIELPRPRSSEIISTDQFGRYVGAIWQLLREEASLGMVESEHV